jgi:ribosomal subunit interface protein
MNTKINIKATNLELTAELRNHVEEKISAIEKFMSLTADETPIVDVEVEKKYGEHHNQGEIYRAEINLQYKGEFFRTESKKEDIKVAVNDAQDDMVRRVRKTREKKSDIFKRGSKSIKRMLKFGKGE